jgi:hypothetical protein
MGISMAQAWREFELAISVAGFFGIPLSLLP